MLKMTVTERLFTCQICIQYISTESIDIAQFLLEYLPIFGNKKYNTKDPNSKNVPLTTKGTRNPPAYQKLKIKSTSISLYFPNKVQF